MNSKFDKDTGDGFFTFDKNDVFEALCLWCQKKGICLKDRQIKFFDCSGDPHFVLEMGFNAKNKER